MSKEELIVEVRNKIREAVNFGMDPGTVAEKIVNSAFEYAEEKTNNSSMEDCIARIKQLAAKRNIGNVEIELKY